MMPRGTSAKGLLGPYHRSVAGDQTIAFPCSGNSLSVQLARLVNHAKWTSVCEAERPFNQLRIGDVHLWSIDAGDVVAGSLGLLDHVLTEHAVCANHQPPSHELQFRQSAAQFAVRNPRTETLMQVEPLSIEGAWVFTPKQHGDARGVFLEVFKAPVFEQTVGHALDVQQVNTSVSAAGVVRGIHFADVPPGQAKYVTCLAGAALDVVVDIRRGSPTFGRYETVLLDDVDRRAVYLSEGLGHAFMALADGTVVTYFCSTGYNPAAEHGVNPLDPQIGIEWPSVGRDGRAITPELSAKDHAAPSLSSALDSGLLPTYQEVRDWIRARQ